MLCADGYDPITSTLSRSDIGLPEASHPFRRPGESRDPPVRARDAAKWIPAFAGKTVFCDAEPVLSSAEMRFRRAVVSSLCRLLRLLYRRQHADRGQRRLVDPGGATAPPSPIPFMPYSVAEAGVCIWPILIAGNSAAPGIR